jgi:hypothetical protein
VMAFGLPFVASSDRTGMRARDATETGLINPQFKEDIAIRAKARGYRHRCRHAVKPIAAGMLGWAGFAVPKRGRVDQAQAWHHPATGLDTEPLHHFTDMGWLTFAASVCGHNSHSFINPASDIVERLPHLTLIWIKPVLGPTRPRCPIECGGRSSLKSHEPVRFRQNAINRVDPIVT